MNDPPDPSIPSINSYEQAWQRLIDLISCAIPRDELPSLIETIFSDEKITNMIDCLLGVSAQAFIDVIDGVCHHTLYFRGVGLFICDLHVLLVRHWITSISCHISDGDV